MCSHVQDVHNAVVLQWLLARGMEHIGSKFGQFKRYQRNPEGGVGILCASVAKCLYLVHLHQLLLD